MARVLCAMSGGVDSSVAAALLRDEGHEVTGVTMKLWGGDSDTGCCSVSDVDDARRVADQLGIEHHVFNFGEDFEKWVVGPYVADHQAGRTPNPCIECNRHIKFDRLLERAEVLEFDYVATGHHAKVVQADDGTLLLGRGYDYAKDQSYVLHMLDQIQLAKLLLPIGSMTKDRVRELAAGYGMRTASKPDSQDVCFITSVQGRGKFLEERINLTPGRIVDTDGSQVGQVEGVQLVTIGQRKGLDVGGHATPRYVVDIDVPTSTITLGTKNDLLTNVTALTDAEWSAGAVSGNVLVQTNAHGDTATAVLDADSITWDKPHRKIAAGQSLVFYRQDPEHGELVVGGATATKR